MQSVKEKKLEFLFPKGWVAVKYDDTAFYRKTFIKNGDPKAVDIIFIDENNNVNFLEVKDFTCHEIENKKRIVTGELIEESRKKVYDTLVGMWAAKFCNDESLKKVTNTAFNAKSKIKIILFFQNCSAIRSPFSPSKILADLRAMSVAKFKTLNLKPVVCDMNNMPANFKWLARRTARPE